MKPLFYGAAAATAMGLLFGAALKAEVSPQSSYGQQLLVSEARTRDPNAMDSWYPTEGAPPTWMEIAALPQGEDLDALDRQIEALLRYAPASRPAPTPASYEPEPAVGDTAVETDYAALPDGPQPYLPSSRGDILAASDPAQPVPYDPPASVAPLWGWDLPDAGAGAPDRYGPPPGAYSAAG
jgi:hypothetical protein